MKNNTPNAPKNKFNASILVGLFFILLLPIIILPPTLQPSDWSRACLFRITLTLLAMLVFYKFFYKKQISISLPKLKNPVILPLAVLLVLAFFIFLSVIFSEDIMFSIFGSPMRAGGFFNLLFFILFAVFLPLFISESGWQKLFRVVFIAGILASLLAIVQYFNLLSKLFLSYEGGATPSFLGNSTFLAIYMLFLAFLAFSLFLNEKDIKKKLFYICLCFLFGFTILISGSRATYLGMLIGFLYFLFFYPFKKLQTSETPFFVPENNKLLVFFSRFLSWFKEKNIKILKISAGLILLFAVIAVSLFNFFPQIGEKNGLLKTLSDRVSFQKIATDITGTRLSAWQITWQEIKDKPIFGWGPENFYIGFEKYYNPAASNLQRLWWDRPHNAFLEMWANSGVFAFTAYLIFWAVLFFRLQKLKQKDENTLMAHCLQAMFLGYLAVLFFNFDNFSTYLISFFFIGYSFFLLFNQNPDENFLMGAFQKSIFQKKPVFIFLLALFVIFLWIFNIKPLYLNEQISYASALTSSKRCSRSLPLMENVWKSGGILKPYSALKYADFLRLCASSVQEKEAEYAAKGLEAMKQAAALQSKYTRTWIFMGSFADVLAAKEENPDNRNKLLTEAMGYLEKAKTLSPGRQEILIEMEKNYLVSKNYEAMKKIAYDCIKIDGARGECYWYLGIAEIFMGDQENGKKHILESKDKNYNDPPYIQLGAAYISQKNYKDAFDTYNYLVNIYPDNASYHAVMAFLAKQLGNYDKAIEQTIEVFKLQPENKNVMEFVEALLGSNPNNPILHSSLAYIYSQTDKPEKAKQEYLTAKSLYAQLLVYNPNNADYHYNFASVLKELGEYERSYQEAITSEKLDPNFHKKVVAFMQIFPAGYWKRYQKEMQ